MKCGIALRPFRVVVLLLGSITYNKIQPTPASKRLETAAPTVVSCGPHARIAKILDSPRLHAVHPNHDFVEKGFGPQGGAGVEGGVVFDLQSAVPVQAHHGRPPVGKAVI